MKKFQICLLSLVVLLVGFASSAMAVLPATVTTQLGLLDTLISDLEAAIWPIIGAVLLAFATIKLVKKFWNKAA